MTKDKKIIYTLIGVIIGIMLSVALFSHKAAAKTVREYLGEWYISTYTAGSNTPSRSRATSSGATATEGWTCAVDYINPLVPLGSIVEIEGFGIRKVQDYGGFGRYNGGMRAIDVFVNPGEGGLFCRKVWHIREETAAEKKERQLKERQAKEAEWRKPFVMFYDKNVPHGVVITDPQIISGGTIRIDWDYYDVECRKGIGKALIVGDLATVIEHSQVIPEIWENAVG